MINKRETDDKQVITNKNERNKEYYIYFINIYKNKQPKNWNERMKFLHEIREDENYKFLTPEEQSALRMYVMGGNTHG